MNQKGGILLPFKNEKNNAQTFLKYLENSAISKLSMGSYGLTLISELILTPSPDSNWDIGISRSTGKYFYYDKTLNKSIHKIPEELLNDPRSMPFPNYYKKLVPNDSYGKPIVQLVIKLCVIGDDTTLFVNNVFNQRMHVVTQEDFQKEINIQTDIYFKTMQYLQPIAPGIVYADILKDIKKIDPLLKLIVNNSNKEKDMKKAISSLFFFLNTNQGSSGLGIIGMEVAGKGDTLSKLDKYFIGIRDFSRMRTLQNVARYTLLKLALDTEYNQNDFHKNNVIMVQTPNYFDKGEYALQSVIIDYGRSTKIPPEIMEKIRDLVSKKDYIKALTYLCDKSYSYKMVNDIAFAKGYYGWVCGDYNMNDVEYEEYIKNLLTKINEDIKSYNSDPSIFPKKTPLDSFQLKLKVEKPMALEQYNNDQIDKLFQLREIAIDKNVNAMKLLHDSDPNVYPLLPVSNQIKNQLYNGMIGGIRRKRRNNNKTKKRQTNKNKKSYRNKK